MLRIPINDLTRDSGLREEIISALSRVYDRGWFVLGQEVSAFEQEFAGFCGVKHCVGLANGTDALELALRSLDVKEGDRVVTVANASMYSTTAILAVGGIPVYVDIDESTLLMSPQDLKRVIDEGISAVIVTHLYGRMADLPSLLELTDANDIPVIEDCAQAHGAELRSKRAGSWGKVACFSFYPTKNLGAIGDGGAITTNDERIADKIRELRQYGWDRKYHSIQLGGRNSRLDELQAAVLRVKLPHLDQWNGLRRDIATQYHAGVKNPNVVMPSPPDERDVCHLFVLRTATRGSLSTYLAELGIGSDVHYPLPDYAQPSLSGVLPQFSLPKTEEACAKVMTIPCFPGMRADEVENVIQALNSWRPD